MGKCCCHFFSAVFEWIHFIVAGKDDIHESLDEFEIGQIRLLTAELATLEDLEKNPHKLIMGIRVLPLFLSYY